jgi:hypothetical protein
VPIISKFDATRDLKGTFFVASGAFAGTCERFKEILEEQFELKLAHDRNSHSTCIQFD